MSMPSKTIEQKIEILLSIDDMTEQKICEVTGEDYLIVRPALVRLENAKKVKAKIVNSLNYYTLINKG